MRKSSHRIEARTYHSGRHVPKRTYTEAEPKAAPRYKKVESAPAELTGEAKRRFDDMFRNWK